MGQVLVVIAIIGGLIWAVVTALPALMGVGVAIKTVYGPTHEEHQFDKFFEQ